MRRGGQVGQRDTEIERSVERAISTEESRIGIFGEGYTRQSLALGKQYVPALLGHIVVAKPLQYEREIWRALKDIARDDLAWRLYCAGVTAVCNERAGCDKDGYKIFVNRPWSLVRDL
jgi:hypothetical protein